MKHEKFTDSQQHLSFEEAQEIARRVEAGEDVDPDKVAQLLEYLRVNSPE